ncbi:MAG: alpha/beta hydrolase-fold protein [Bacteroidota bacterium]
MKHKITFIILLLSTQIKAQTDLPQVVNGKIDRIDKFTSKYVTPRNIDIWLPSGYSDSTKYAVLYMHDGQMLYDPSTTWNKQAWDIDDVASVLMAENRVKNFIVVGIWNGGKTRHQDYFPQKPFEKLSQAEKDTITAQLKRVGRTEGAFQPQSDNYLKFIVKELKPYIDKRYSVYTNRENTFIAGSSMGGLISLYAICEYPEVFGGAACLSTHWVGSFTTENNPFTNSMIRYLSKKLPNPKSHKIYFDCGDQTLDAMYPEIQKRIDSVMVKKGFDSHCWITKYFPGENHSEQAWSKRLGIPLEFLLSSPAQP